MSRTRVFVRLGIAIGAVFAMLWVASPAFAADDVQTEISGLSSTLNAGSNRAEGFRTTMQNKTDQEIFPIRRIIVVRLAGITPATVRIFQGAAPLQVQSVAEGEVRATDFFSVRLGPDGKNNDSSRQEFAIQFTSGAPNGKGQVIFQAYRDDQLLGSTAKNITVKGGVGATATRTTDTQTEAVPGRTGGVTMPVSPLAGNPSASSTSGGPGIPAVFYVLGAILVAAGGAILWLLFRPRPALVADHPTGDYQPVGYEPGGYQPGGYEPVRPPSLDYPDPAPTLGYSKVIPPSPAPPLSARPAHAATVQPTQVMPTVLGPAAPPPPADPWSTEGGGTDDDTRGFGPPRT